MVSNSFLFAFNADILMFVIVSMRQNAWRFRLGEKIEETETRFGTELGQAGDRVRLEAVD